MGANMPVPSFFKLALGVLSSVILPTGLLSQGIPTTGTPSMAETARRFSALAPRLVQSAAIHPGDLVTISGGPTLISEMEALGAEVQKAGGTPLLVLDSPQLTRTFYSDFPEQHLHQLSPAWNNFLAREVAVQFILPTGEDFASLRKVSPERRAQVDKALAREQTANAAGRNRGTSRVIFIGVPSPSDTVSIQMDYREYESMAWAAMEADYSEIAAKGQEIKRVLQRAKRLRITSPEGTDFRVELGKRPVVVNAGIVRRGTQGPVAARTAAVPGGTVRFAPLESSANGKIRAAEDQCSKLVRDEAVDVRNGMPENIHAASDEQCIQDSFKDAGRFGSVVIGLNPGIHFTHVPSYGPQLEAAAGVVSINFGPNPDLSGTNPPVAGGWTVPLLRATVEADGKVIVRDGRLVM
jgi:leucyl aminopeptidase (aminopeptidase T)